MNFCMGLDTKYFQIYFIYKTKENAYVQIGGTRVLHCTEYIIFRTRTFTYMQKTYGI